MRTLYLRILLIISFLISSYAPLEAQVKIGTSPQTINAASILELESSNKAFVIPRMNSVQMSGITPLEGAMVYNTDEQCVHYYDGAAWINICAAFGNSFSITNDAVVNSLKTILIQQTDNNYNLEVALLNGDNIQDGSINSINIANGAIINTKIGDDQINSRTIQDKSILARDISAGPIPNMVLQTNSAGTAAIWGTLDGSNIPGSLLSDEQNETGTGDTSITVTNGDGATLKAAQLRVTDSGITTIKLADNAVSNRTLAIDAVQTNNILDATIIEADIADNAVTNIKIIDNAIGTIKIQDDAVTTVKIGTAGVSDANKILGTNTKGEPEWQDATTLAASLGEDVTSTNGSIIGIALDATLVAMDLEVKVDDDTIEVNPITGLQVKDGGITIGKIGTDVGNENKILGTDLNGDPQWIDKTTISLSEFDVPTGAINLGSFKITNVLDPTDPQDVATLNYVNTQIGTSKTLVDGLIYIGNSSNFATQVLIKGNARIDNTGVLIIENNAITTDKILDDNVTEAKIKPSITNGQVLTTVLGNTTWANLPLDTHTKYTAGNALSLSAVNEFSIDNDAITNTEIANGTIEDADISGTAEILGTKIVPNFGTLPVLTTGTFGAGNSTINGTLSVSGQTIINAGTAGVTTLPTNAGTANQVLITDGLGAASWATIPVSQNLSNANLIQTSTRTYNTNSSNLEFIASNSNVLFTGTNSNIGIGNLPGTPQDKLDVGGQIRARNGFASSEGSVTNPGYGFYTNGDTNTGMFRIAEDEIGFSVGGDLALRIDQPTDDVTNVIITGAFSTNIRTDATSPTVTITDNDYTVVINNANNIILPPPATTGVGFNRGKIYIIKNISGGIVTTNIDYIPSTSSTGIDTLQPGVTQLQSDGTNWQQIN